MVKPKVLLFERRAMGYPLADLIAQKLPEARKVVIEDHRAPGALPCDAKQALIVAEKRGEAVKPFRAGRHGARRADFYVDHAHGCQFDCEYCFLQGYFDHRVPVVFANQNWIVRCLESTLRTARGATGRYHCGELSDSLCWEPLTGFAAEAAGIASRHDGALLELRTKSVEIDDLKKLRPPPNVVLRWTVSPPEVARTLERGAPSSKARLAAAGQMQRHGWRVALCLDPVFHFPGWREAYGQLFELAFRELDAAAMDRPVFGAFRYLPELKEAMMQRSPASRALCAEFVKADDGKYRYPRPLRSVLYRSLAAMLEEVAPGLTPELCMETPAVIRDVFGRHRSSSRAHQ